VGRQCSSQAANDSKTFIHFSFEFCATKHQTLTCPYPFLVQQHSMGGRLDMHYFAFGCTRPPPLTPLLPNMADSNPIYTKSFCSENMLICNTTQLLWLASKDHNYLEGGDSLMRSRTASKCMLEHS
jgi:hypothetical protein